MAAKTRDGLVRRQFPSDSLFQGCRNDIGVTDCNCEPIERRIVADKTFVVDAITLKHPGLSTIPKAPANRQSNGLSSITYRISTFPVLRLYHVGVAKFLKREVGMRLQDWIGIRRLQSKAHRRTRLGLRLRRMAAGTSGCRIVRRCLRGNRTAGYEQQR